MPQNPSEFLPSWPSLAGGLLYLILAPFAWRPFRQLLPPRREPLAPWTVIEVAAAYLFFLFGPVMIAGMLLLSGLGQRLYGLNLNGLESDQGAVLRLGILAGVLAFPLQVAAILGFLHLGSGTLPYQLGLTGHRAGRNLLLGVLGCALLMPPVLLVNALAHWAYAHLAGKGITEHIFVEMARKGLAPGEWVLVIVAAMVVAPILEELVFRGVIQKWAARNWWAGEAILALAMTTALMLRGGEIVRFLFQRDRVDGPTLLDAFAPAFFVLLMVIGYGLVRWTARTPFAPALYATSLLFAIGHASAWPTPVALFVLALGLGWLARRTNSLVGPILLHALFNGVACVELLLLT